MKRRIMFLMVIICAVFLFSVTSQASIINGSVWEGATAASINPAGGPPATAATSSFYMNVTDQIDFEAYGTATYDQFLDSPTWVGTDIGGNNMVTSGGVGTFFQFTGYLNMVNGETFSILHDDGFWLQIDGTTFDYSTPVTPTLATLNWTGATGIYAFTLNYGAYNSYPEVLQTRGLTFSQVPEPATMLMFGLGLAGLAGLRRKLQK